MIYPFPAQQEVPPRIRVALSFLQDLTIKTATKAAINDSDIEEIIGQELSQCEKEAQTDACRLLSDYFTGTLKPDQWECILLERHQIPFQPVEGIKIRCMCASQERSASICHLCKGSGSVLIFPDKGE